MYLSIVEIRNFRSLKELRVELQPGLNVLVGRNGTGKSNLLQAIRHAIGPAGARGEPIWLERDDFYRASSTADSESTMAVTLTFSDLSEQQRAHFYEIVEFDLSDLSKSKAVLRFQASWPKGKRQAEVKRTGGPVTVEQPEVPSRLLASLPVTFLPALRDAAMCLAPGIRNRLAVLLQDLAERRGGSTEDEIKSIYKKANDDLEAHRLISEVKASLQSTTQGIAGSDYAPSAIKAAPVDFQRILRTLQVQMDGAPIESLDASGLGYNNLLYIAIVLEHLKSPDLDECPLLLVEEPEAHLHPQLTILLADYLANKTPGASTPQTIVTTHSPVLAAKVPPGRVHVLFVDPDAKLPHCNSLATAGMSEEEARELQRMMDVTRATLYFAKGAILVEGISEALLVPVLAKRLGYDLASLHVSVIPICGVAFRVFKKILDPAVLGIPVAILTDGDPPVTRGDTWEKDAPVRENDGFAVSDRTLKLQELFREHQTVRVRPSKLTLEYDLAEAGDGNAAIMAEVWESCFAQTPGTLNRKRVADAGSAPTEHALAVWRGICRAEHSGSKADFAQRLAARIDKFNDDGTPKEAFAVPAYIGRAIKHICLRLKAASASTSASSG